MPKTISIALQKGGVGKTTTVQHLAHALAMSGRKVLMVDADPQGSLSQRYDLANIQLTLANALGVEGPPTATLQEVTVATYQDNLWLVPAAIDPEDRRLALSNRRLANEDRGKFAIDLLLRREPLPYDYILIDTPPGESEVLIAALVASDQVLLPVQLSPMGMEGFVGIDAAIVRARELQELRGEIRLQLLAVLPTFYSRGEVTSDGFLDALQSAEHPDYEDMPLPLAPMPIVETTAFERASTRLLDLNRARTIFEMPVDSPDSPTARGQQAYQQLAEYVLSMA